MVVEDADKQNNIKEYTMQFTQEMMLHSDSGIRYINATLACYLIVMIFLHSHIFRIVCVTELYKPMTFCIREYSLWTATATVTAVVKQKSCIGVLLFFENFQSFLLE